jgi:hypothetical protein
MQTAGDTVALYKVLLNRSEIEKDIYSIDGEFSGMARDHIGGMGMVRCTFKGKIANNNLKAAFIGTGEMAALVHLNGNFRDTLSDVEGKGKYSLSHEQGASPGEWTMKRIKTVK